MIRSSKGNWHLTEHHQYKRSTEMGTNELRKPLCKQALSGRTFRSLIDSAGGNGISPPITRRNMKIKTIGYGCVIPDHNYGNSKYYLEAELEEGETNIPEQFQKLKDIIRAEHGFKSEVENLKSTRQILEQEIYDLKIKAKRFKQCWEKAETSWLEAVKLLESHGVSIPEKLPTKPSFNWLGEESHSEQSEDDRPF